jgi:hypothetical protein
MHGASTSSATLDSTSSAALDLTRYNMMENPPGKLCFADSALTWSIVINELNYKKYNI